MGTAGALAPGTRAATDLPRRSIRFRDVRFGYASSPTPVLDGLNLEIPVGSSLAIVGRNGAGKTTIAKLLCRLYDPQHGAIEVDGVDVRDFDLGSWRERVTDAGERFGKCSRGAEPGGQTGFRREPV